MGWFGRMFGSGSGSSADRRALRAARRGPRTLLDREATPGDLEDLRAFVQSRTGVEFYVEPETTATDTTVMAVAKDGEWTRRRVGSPAVAAKLARRTGVPIYDVTVVGYPESMRRWNERAKADKKVLDRLDEPGGFGAT